MIAQSDATTPTLELGKPVLRELAGGQSHSYLIVLTSGQYIHAVVDQRGIDVVVTLFAPDGKQLTEVDSPNGTEGPEPIFAIAETSGTYRLQVRSLERDVPVGRYEAKVEELRVATEKDKRRVAAENELKEAELLRNQGTRESLQGAIKKYEQSLPLFRDVGDGKSIARVLDRIGLIYNLLGEKQKALDYYNQALKLRREVGDRNGEAVTLVNIGTVYDSSGDKQRALVYFEQALPLYRAVEDRQGEAGTLNNIGLVYDSLGDKQKALDYYGQALPLVRAVGDHQGEAVTLNNIGEVYDSLGERQKALDYYTQALKLIHAIGDRRNEAIMLHNIGEVYESLGQGQKALEYFGQALPLLHIVGDVGGEALTLNSIGGLYFDLGENQKALDYHSQALRLLRTVGDRRGEATTLLNIGSVYKSLGLKQDALNYFEQALTHFRAVGDRSGEAATLAGIGVVDASLGENQKALELFRGALLLIRAVGDRRGEAKVIYNSGEVYASLGEQQTALNYFAEVLPLFRAVGDRAGEAETLNKLMSVYQSLSLPTLAIFYGKQSVDAYQQLRSNIRGLGKDVQKTYLKSIEQTYRGLAGALIKQGRTSEAQQVLNAFKDQQFFDFDQSQSATLKPLTRTPHESDFGSRYERASDILGAIGGQVADLKRKLAERQPTDDEIKELQQFETQLKTASDGFHGFIKKAESEFAQPGGDKDKVSVVSDTREMQAMLVQLDHETGRKTVAVYTIVGETEFQALIIGGDSITSVSTPAKGVEINNSARQLWGLLQSADYEPKTLSNELYKVVFKPVEGKLPKDTKTIMWSLDGNLRYLPMAALYDGTQYLVERFSHVVFTRADKERLTRAASSTWTGYGFAASQARKVEVGGELIEFGPIDFVKDEMQIFRTETNPSGIVKGVVFPEIKFNKASFLNALKQNLPLIHISSHFRFRPGDESRSFLLLGDGTVMTLAEMKKEADLFQGVELLTLSACDTAAQRPDATGREIDAFAELSQRLGAGSVMATLWAVLDRSTASLMKAFYKNRQGGRYTKAEALQKAQLEVLLEKSIRAPLPRVTSPTIAARKAKSSSGEEVVIEPKYLVPFKADKEKPFAHPYYWSPFVLFGNWK